MSERRSFVDLIIDDDEEAFERRVEERAASVAAEVIEQRVREERAINAHFERLPELVDPDSEISRVTRRYVEEMMNDPRYESFSKLDIAERAIERAEVEMMKAGKIGGQSPHRESEPNPPSTSDQSRLSAEQRRYAERMGLKVEEVEKHYRARVQSQHSFRPVRNG